MLALAHAASGATGAVVANDVALGGAAAAVLIVGGPNAGGKTVLMKTVGLAELMARAGLLVAAAPGNRIGFFDAVRADIGDRQSVLGDLSTFSGHLANVAEILNASVSGSALVLLDELMAGTNPDQGAALARATAETLARAAGAGGDHHALRQPQGAGRERSRFANAGMEYDLERLRPTFRLAVGAPGRAYAFDIAARMGLPEALLERARTLAGGSSVGWSRRSRGSRRARRRSGATPSASPRRRPPPVPRPMPSARRRRRWPAASATSATDHARRWAAIAEAREEIGRGPPCAGGGTGRAAEAAARSWPASVPRRWPSSRVRTRAAVVETPALELGRACASSVWARTASSRSSPTPAAAPR